MTLSTMIPTIMGEIKTDMDLCANDVDNIQAILEKVARTEGDGSGYQLPCPTTGEPCQWPGSDCHTKGCVVQ